MVPLARILPQPPPVFPPPPDWMRPAGRRESLEDALFLAGAGLAALHPAARSAHPLAKLWRQRLALACAEACVRLQGRAEDAATLRDHLYLTRPGDDPGPAGRVLQAWRALAATPPFGAPPPDAGWPATLAGLLSLNVDEALLEAFDAAAALSAGRENPVDAAATAAATALRLRPDCRPLALWLADAVLARRLDWPAPAPLLAAHLKREAFRHAVGPQADGGPWRVACADAYGRAAVVAFDLHADLGRRAGRLLGVAPRLRGRDAGETVLKLLTEDASPAGPGRAASDRSMRRLFERLVELGAVRELTGRSTFRLYGL